MYTKLEEECFSKNSINGVFKNTDNFCELIFDGIMCWPATKAGDLAVQQCPGQHSVKNATKICMDTGDWFVNKELNNTWTNYTECWKFFDHESAIVDLKIDLKNRELYLNWLPTIKIISETGYWISLLFLFISLTVFISIKRLQCARNKLHMHLFVSFIMRAVMFLLKQYLFVEGLALSSDLVIVGGKVEYVKEHHNWICKAVTSARNYFTVANYMLLLMEGVFLHNLMFSTIFSNYGDVTVYCLLGWGIPMISIIPWIFLRIKYEDTLCWTTTDWYMWLIEAPIAASIIINFFFFVKILRVLCSKINSMYMQQRKIRYRRLIRSTLILVLLLGVPYTLSLIISYSASGTFEVVWIFCDQTFTAFQGFIVTLTYCLLNAEVQAELKQKYRLFKCGRRNFRRSRTISHTQQFTIPMQDDTSPEDDPKSPIH